ncbi:MAG: tRNA (guanine(10)-N(2))-dimethyltransferase [Nitrososphaerales archaeon]
MLSVPTEELKMLPAFFNPRGKLVRDVSIVCYDAHSKLNPKPNLVFADALAGTGARGIRVANEVPSIERVILNDINSKALEYAKESAKLNNVEEKCVFSRSEVCSFLTSRKESEGERFDYVDLDPFGSPSDHIDCAIRSVKEGGMLSFSATDSAVLCGVYPKVSLRKYLGLPLRSEYCHEVGMRLLFGLAAQSAMRLEAGIEPLFCHHNMHYFRAYLTIRVGNTHSRENEKEIGFILHCFLCGHRSIVSREVFFSPKERIDLSCPECKKEKVAIAGPLWIGKIQSSDFVSSCHEQSDLGVFSSELDIPLYYDLNAIKVKSGLPRINVVVEELKARGYAASRTRLNPNSLRTDATKKELQKIVLELVR